MERDKPPRLTTETKVPGQAGSIGRASSVNGAAPTTAGYEYDAAGRQTSRPGSGPLVWDGEGELTAVGAAGSRTSMLYDANGERLTRTDSSGTTVYLPGGQEIRVEHGKVVSAVRYYSFDGQTVAVRTGKGLGAVTSLFADLHGTALIAIANTTWTAAGVVKQYTDPFGAARGAGVDVPGERQFLDKTRDVSTGLTQVGARYYDETTGRFISVDPVLDLTNPQQWNAYVYANNNPTTWSDPTGLFSWGSIGDVLSGFGKGTYNTVTSVTRSLNPVSVVQSITAMPAIAKENGGGAWGWYTSATLTFNPMYGAVANTYATVDAVQAGDVEAAAFHATSAVQTTAITAATLYLPAKGGIGAMTGKGTRPTTTVNGGGGRRATVPEATTPELPATAANTASEVATVAPRVVHGNSASSPATAYLYRLSSTETGYLKTGISQNPMTRYSQTFMQDKTMEILQSGTRREMLNLERFIVERDPGLLNFERWAGQFAGDIP
ncbi:RHS repeat-associated core domain-containing protein [Cellulomonas palmilytica]|uniref:RHS repeat-associated core domain-containing protein n=1 Tax=Cellulomonas palmilytica TaxID=2608402 RepID=UPI001F2EE72C|nr:RHS repeat-associated core domain-containing protein [Cellulomonas palmilytica]UJP39787.1 RHS repeat-associated core domain-containing protein [Cellulomonas palmilytica]